MIKCLTNESVSQGRKQSLWKWCKTHELFRASLFPSGNLFIRDFKTGPTRHHADAEPLRHIGLYHMQNIEDIKTPREESTKHVPTQPRTDDSEAQKPAGADRDDAAVAKPSAADDSSSAERLEGASSADALVDPDTAAQPVTAAKPAVTTAPPVSVTTKAAPKTNADSRASHGSSKKSPSTSADPNAKPKPKKATIGSSEKTAKPRTTMSKETDGTQDKASGTSIMRIKPSIHSLVKPSGRSSSKAITKRTSRSKFRANGGKPTQAKKKQPAAEQSASSLQKPAPTHAVTRAKRQQAKSAANTPAKPTGKLTATAAPRIKETKSPAKHIATPKLPEPSNIAASVRSFFEDHRDLPQRALDDVLSAKDWIQENAHTVKIIAPITVAVIYIIASLFFSSHYLPGTTINADDVSFRSAETATAIAKDKVEGYSLKVSGDGLNSTIQTSDIGLSLDEGVYRDDAASHLPGWLWLFRLFGDRTYQVGGGVSYDKEKVDSVISSAVTSVNEKATLPKDASITYDKKKSSFVAVDEKGGTAIEPDSAIAAVERGVSMLLAQVELGDAELQQPKLHASAPEMDGAIKKANALLELKLPLLVNNKTIETVDKNLLQSWITLDDTYTPQGDLDAITAWAKKDLSAEVDTVGTVRTYTRPNDGKRIEVYGGGTYGWNMSSADLGKIICERLRDKSDEPIELPMQSKGEVFTHGMQDWGPRFVDVDLGEQYVRMFDESSNVIMESECVSGNMSEGNDTVTGVFYLEDKQSPAVLIGLDNDGDGLPDYETDVQYWMPFYGGYGIHDALWRNSFGGDAFQYDGSHGCVNLPYYAAEILYGLIKVGDTVVVHW